MWSLLGFIGCTGANDTDEPSYPVSENPVLVYITPDTLGLVAAEESGFCARLTGLLEEYGLDLACPEGGVSPSSWTGEAHTRMLWPQETVGSLRSNAVPRCELTSVFAAIKKEFGGSYIFAADNPVVGSYGGGSVCDEDGLASWHQGTDAAFEMLGDSYAVFPLPEEDHAVHSGIDAFVDAMGTGEPTIGFFNIFEVGGHQPRCYFGPYTESCEALWQIAVEGGIVATGAPREETWLDADFGRALNMLVTVKSVDQEMEFRPIYWGTMNDAIEYYRETMFDSRLVRVLDGLEDQGRLGDLVLVIAGDHGENPCVRRPDNTLSCAHSGLTTEWTGIVPVYVSPASLAETWENEGFIGDATHPWSTVNLSYALLSALAVDEPSDWPTMEPVGSATSWTCRDAGEAAAETGVRIEGAQSLRCSGGTCEAWSWGVPTDIYDDPEPIDPVPDNLLSWAGPPSWFDDACGE